MKTTDMPLREFAIAKRAAANYLATIRAGYRYLYIDGKWQWVHDPDGSKYEVAQAVLALNS